MMANVTYRKNGVLYTTAGVLEGLISVEPEVDPYDIEACDLPDKPSGFKILVSEPIRF